MKFARFSINDEVRIGLVEGERVRVVTGSIFGRYEPTETSYALSEVTLLPPTEPSKIICVAHNYSGLVEQIGESMPREPVLFLKPPSCLIGNEAAIIIPSDAERVIFEGELAVVIKDKMKNVPQNDTLMHVAGYTCFNDVTERAMIERDQLMLSLGKGMDTFGPCGPFLVTGVDPNRLAISTRVNGKKKQQDNTSNCIFDVAYLLYYISRKITLYPGDIVTTGTPQGVDTLLPGDRVEVEIENVGKLGNPVRAETPSD
jgi:2-keto-4-pentenoate hydratase/2-oxohepta-3-ene-1,7-dioic acid hydratase in catechol pathway